MGDLGEWLAKISIGGVGAWTAVGLIVVALIRQKPITRKLANEREGNLLKERAQDMRGMRRRITELEQEQRVDRHTLSNLEQCLDTLLMMIEISPERAQEAAGKVRKMREEMKRQTATEKGAVMSAKIEGAAAEDAEEAPAELAK